MTAPGVATAIPHVGVVIPARDESDRIRRCLDSVFRASAQASSTVMVIVVADGCLDDTAQRAREAGAEVVEIDASNVGTARAVGAAVAVRRGATWLANTDADSVVPENWLSSQLALAAEGADVVVGTVRPDFDELAPEQVAAWKVTHENRQALGHVHGANLGIRTASYLASGGYRPLPEHEDTDLVHRLERYNVVSTDGAEVITSGRLVGRTPGGYARYLRENLTRLDAVYGS
jgi:glycosyltransferase involved in cell wall biosynthesis